LAAPLDGWSPMVAKYLRFVLRYISLNFSAAIEYRGAFLAQCLGMALNDLVFFIFWAIFFARFGEVSGWGLRDVVLLWGVAAASVGLAVALFGNCTRMATIIVQGQLDYYLGLPKEVLVHVLVSRMGLAGWGDAVFGVVAYVFVGRLDPGSIALYVLLVGVSMATFVAFMVVAGSLAFFIGSAEAAAFQAQQAVVTFSLYPGGMYHGWVKVLLFTAIPAGFISHLPAELLRSFDPALFGGLLAFASASWAVAIAVFHLGLRRYESGNLVLPRG
jgi:ABC-2 type transport system permease protein